MRAVAKGVPAIKRVMHRAFSVSLSEQQAHDLWKETTVILEQAGMIEVVEAVDLSREGILDTFDRDMLMDAIGKLMTGMSWPTFGTPDPEKDTFFATMRRSIGSRGFSFEEEQCYATS